MAYPEDFPILFCNLYIKELYTNTTSLNLPAVVITSTLSFVYVVPLCSTFVWLVDYKRNRQWPMARHLISGCFCHLLKGLSHEIDFKNVDNNLQNLA
jgi:hypothetical protein